MNLPNIVIPISIQFSLRYVLRSGLIKKISSFSNPIILLGWHDPNLINELNELGIKVFLMPNVIMDPKYERIRKKIHEMHFIRINSSSTSIDRRRKQLFHSKIIRFKQAIKYRLVKMEYLIPNKYTKLCELENKIIDDETNIHEFKKIINQTNPDYILSITPYFINEEFLLRAASTSKAKLITSILSFDNLTTRPRIPVIFDHYLLWNKYNKEELIRIYPVAKHKGIFIVGTPQFDFYYDNSYLWPENYWREKLGIPEGRRVILFAAGPKEIAPIEPHWLQQVDEAITNKEIFRNPIILLRRHPVDSEERWNASRNKLKNVIFDDPWPMGKDIISHVNITHYDLEKLASTLYYSDVHLNASSTMTIDGAIFDKPQIGPGYDDSLGKSFDREMRELYQREHYLPITQSGGLQIAYSRQELINMINQAFSEPERYSKERKKMVFDLCTYNDGKSTDRVVETIKKIITN